MSASTFAGRRHCPNCNHRIPPGRGTRCPKCQHPLFLDEQDEKLDALVATGPDGSTRKQELDDTMIPGGPGVDPVPAAPILPESPPGTREGRLEGPPAPPQPPPWTTPPQAPPPRRRAGLTVGLVALTVVLTVALGYAAFRVARPLVGPPAGQVTATPPAPTPGLTDEPSPDPTATDEPSSTPEPEPSSTEPELKRVKNVTAEASSTLPPDNYSYEVENTLDLDPVTAWNSNGQVVGPFAQVTLTYRFSKPVELREIEIYNGYQRSDLTFTSNSRVQRLRVTTHEADESFKLKDKQGKQTISFDFGTTDEVVLTIEEVYRDDTTKYYDCAISEVTFFRLDG